MDLIRRRMNSLLTEAARKAIVALEPQSPCAKELSKINEVDNILERIAKELVTRVEKKSGRLKLPKPCRYLLLDL